MLTSSLLAGEWFFVFFHVGGVNRKGQKMLMEMNEDSFVGKIQKKRRVFFLGKRNFE